ncbi:MAG: ATP-binding protein [Methylococcales bacterium]
MANDLPLIYVDAVLLQQVLINLLDNADKYSPPELPIDVVVATTPFELSIIVMDRDPGIPVEMQQKIFDKFFRVQQESAQSGVGLGLAIAEKHGNGA